MPYVEDFLPGRALALGRHTVSREEIIRFASDWDPQRFHVEDERDGSVPFDGLVASGWHTASIFMKLYVRTLLAEGGAGSPGVDELRWPEPVRPGDTLTATFTVERIMPSLGYRDRAIVIPQCELTNQHGKTALSMRLHTMFLRRPTGPAGG